MAVPNIFANATTSIPLSQLDQNFATAITLGNTAVYLGNTTTTIGNVTLTNVTISSGNSTVTKETVTTITSPASTALTIQSNSTTAMTIDTSQNVGIGTTSPVYILDMVRNGSNGYVQLTSNSGAFYSAQYLNGATQVVTRLISDASNGYVETASNNPLLFRINTTERMRIDTSGNVGIGTSSPNGKLDVSVSGGVNLALTKTGGAYLSFYEGSTGRASINGLSSADGLAFGTGSAFTERMRLDSSGALVVGNTGSVWGERISSQGPSSSTTSPVLGCYTPNTSYATSLIFVQSETASGTGWQFLNGRSAGGVQRVIIYGNGNIVNSNNSYGALSDIKLKENIADATPKLEDVLKLRVRNFNFKEEPNQKQIGFVAQELEKVFPGLVEVTSDTDKDGVLTGETTKAIKTSVLIPILVKAMQEQQAMIEQLKSDVAALKGAK